jgi:hypothetical protein
MQSPEVARAIPGLVAAGLLSPERAAPLLAAARGDLLSVRSELRALAGLAVALLLAGAGALIARLDAAVGPLVVAVALALAALVTLAVAWRRSPGFTWGRDGQGDWLLDALVLLAIGLLGAELAWTELKFTPLGANWPAHLLVMSLVAGALAVRFDSLAAWSLALSTFAAWRGVAVLPTAASVERVVFGRHDEVLRANLLVCAVLFAALGVLARRFDRKAHFEPATTFLAVLAAGLALARGLDEAGRWPLSALALALLGGGVAAWAFRARRRALFALGALGLYVAMTRLLFALPFADGLGCFWFALSTVGAIVILVAAHRRFERGGPG